MDNKKATQDSEGARIPDGIKGITDIVSLVDFLALVLDHVYSGIIVCDRDCRILFMNRVYAELLGVDPKKIAGEPLEKFFPYTRMPLVLSSGRAELGQKCTLKTELPMLVNRIPLKIKGQVVGVILQTIFRDYKAMTDLTSRLKTLEMEASYYKKGLERVLRPLYSLDSIIGKSKAVRELKELVFKYAQTDAPVLITGETGSGKEMLAHAVHAASPRISGPFVCINCAAIPRDLLEAELFGYASGAFTGARRKGKVGQIQLAHLGTLFLDEIGELSIKAQVKLLRVLETKLLDRVGGLHPLHVDFRLVAATNRDPREMMRQGKFRDDLYYRLSTMSVTMPPLARRGGDVELLANHFLATMDRGDARMSEEVKKALKTHRWPGNVRELKNVIERAISLAEGDVIELAHLPDELLQERRAVPRVCGFSDTRLVDAMAHFEKAFLERALSANDGVMTKTARQLGVSRSTLYEKCRKHGLAPHPVPG
ncbi:MAG: PAS domain-containing protein [Desulfobacterales bacterium]|nr:PAS domain-containing protein [Desulfobacterales bacterium]